MARRAGLRNHRSAGARRHGRRLQGPATCRCCGSWPSRCFRIGPTPAKRSWPAFVPRPMSSLGCSIRISSRFTTSARLPADLILSWSTWPAATLPQHLNGTPQSVRLAAQFVEVLARAVQAAHANGVVHRDLKPSNILLIARRARRDHGSITTRGREALDTRRRPVDGSSQNRRFRPGKDCATATGRAHRQRSLTVTGDLLGTPSYMAPNKQRQTARRSVRPPISTRWAPFSMSC